MIRPIKYIWLMPVLAALLLASCYDVENDREVCDYKLQLRYDYNEENGTTKNMIEYYVYSIDEYIFDEQHRLFDYRRITPDVCREMMNSEWDLPPGKDSVIAIGNMDDRSSAYDTANPALTRGVTLRENFRLALDNAEVRAGDTRGPAERLYHGYRTFTVKEQGISRVRVDMVNAHLRLTFRVTWKNNATPPRGVGYHATLETVPSEYALMPEFIYPAGSFTWQNHNPAAHDAYPSQSEDVTHHIPLTCHGGANRLTHRCDTKVNADSEMWGEFTTYRVKLDDCPKLSILDQSGGLIVPRVIDLRGYMEHYRYDPDHTLRQEYHISIVVDGNTIIMVPLSVADWDEGGIL